MRIPFVPTVLIIVATASLASAQITPRHDTSGSGGSITRPHPINSPSIRDTNLRHVGAVETWGAIAPRKNLAPSVTRLIGKDLHLALFNYSREGGKLESSVAFQVKPFVDNQKVEVQVFAVAQNDKPVVPTALGPAQAIALKRQGAILPFTVEMKEGESLTCEMLFLINGEERGRATIRVNSRGLDFLPDRKNSATTPTPKP